MVHGVCLGVGVGIGEAFFFFFSNGTGEAIIVVKSLGEASFAAKGNLLS